MPKHIENVVAGAGVVGLAIGRALALAGREVVVLEAEPQFGAHSSSRNSEVIHAGIYYPEDFLKTRLCVTGKQMLYEYCDTRAINHKRIGKLIVATDQRDVHKLDNLRQQAARNQVNDLVLLDAQEVRDLEPRIECVAGLLSPSTGIIDAHELMLALQADIEAAGGVVLGNSRVSDLQSLGKGFEFEVSGDTFECGTLINSAGLWADTLVSGIVPVPKIRYATGHYFVYQGKSPFDHLIYPLPADGGLGIHATNDLAGEVRFGPDVSWIDEIDYRFDESRKPDFVRAIRRYFPDFKEEKLTAGYTGIRPRLQRPGEPAADFAIQDESGHGVPGLVNLFGIESPGLTASLAIGEYVEQLLADM